MRHPQIGQVAKVSFELTVSQVEKSLNKKDMTMNGYVSIGDETYFICGVPVRAVESDVLL